MSYFRKSVFFSDFYPCLKIEHYVRLLNISKTSLPEILDEKDEQVVAVSLNSDNAN